MSGEVSRRAAVAALAFAALGAPGRSMAHAWRPGDSIAWLRARVPGALAAGVAAELQALDPTLTPAANTELARSLAPETARGFERMQRAIASDYRQGRLVTVAGWMVSRTEAQLVAAAA